MRCARCGSRGAYPGARFCGASCSARFEGGDHGPTGLRLIWNLLAIFAGFVGAMLFMAAWAEATRLLVAP